MAGEGLIPRAIDRPFYSDPFGTLSVRKNAAGLVPRNLPKTFRSGARLQAARSPLSTYRGTADPPAKAKAIAAVVAVHAALAFVILSGLNVRMVSRAVERLQTFDITPPPPPPKVEPPRPKVRQAPKEAGAPAKHAEPTPVVAPQPRIVAPSPIPAAKVAGTGSASNSGAGTSGSGTGAGGSGNGPGGGGDTSRFTPARLVRNLTRGDYRRLAGSLPRGSAMVALRVDTQGLPTNCRVVRSSGDSTVDSGLCPLIAARLRFRPALDDRGRRIPYQLQYVATWTL
jgi:protein TonB